jgi:hypothetical protein
MVVVDYLFWFAEFGWDEPRSHFLFSRRRNPHILRLEPAGKKARCKSRDTDQWALHALDGEDNAKACTQFSDGPCRARSRSGFAFQSSGRSYVERHRLPAARPLVRDGAMIAHYGIGGSYLVSGFLASGQAFSRSGTWSAHGNQRTLYFDDGVWRRDFLEVTPEGKIRFVSDGGIFVSGTPRPKGDVGYLTFCGEA